jgi:hypothetical protein
MSGAMFILFTLVTAGALFAAFLLLSVALKRPFERYDAWRDRYLQRRLDARLARGTDRWFEELRAIRATIERRASEKVVIPSHPIQRVTSAILFVMYSAFIVRDFIAPALKLSTPGWAHVDILVLLTAMVANNLLDTWMKRSRAVPAC